MSPVAVSVGTFDGVHLGHRQLLGAAGGLAADAGLDLVALTLDRHPLALLRPERAPRLLTGLDHKLELLAAVEGVARTQVLVFDRRRADQAPESFVVDTLAGELGARLLVVGSNFRYGRGGSGDVALAERLGRPYGLEVVRLALLEAAPGAVVSSSEIRRLVATGDLSGAARLLGRPHEVRGLLRDAGRSAPALLEVPAELLLPPPGTYEVRAGPLGGPAPSLPAVAQLPGASSAGATVLAVEPAAPALPPWWRSGAPARVAFEASPAPACLGSPLLGQASESASGR